MKIAMIGHKDFPSRAGGVEVVVYELATRLAAKGHEVTVYNRGRQKGHNAYLEQGVRVKRIFTFKKQVLNAMVYSFLATFDTIPSLTLNKAKNSHNPKVYQGRGCFCFCIDMYYF